jgi:hypothetical protein
MILDAANLTQPHLTKLGYELGINISYKGLLTINIFSNNPTELIESFYLFSGERENADKQRDALAFLEKYLPF